MKTVAFADTDGESYLSRTHCEYYDHLAELTNKSGAVHNDVYESEREDWIQNLVLGGMGICFMPEFSVVVPGLQTRPLVEPEVWRDVCIATMPGRRYSGAAKSFMKCARDIKFATSQFAVVPSSSLAFANAERVA